MCGSRGALVEYHVSMRQRSSAVSAQCCFDTSNHIYQKQDVPAMYASDPASIFVADAGCENIDTDSWTDALVDGGVITRALLPLNLWNVVCGGSGALQR